MRYCVCPPCAAVNTRRYLLQNECNDVPEGGFGRGRMKEKREESRGVYEKTGIFFAGR